MNDEDAAESPALEPCDEAPGRAAEAMEAARAEGRSLLVDGNRLTLTIEADRRLEALVDHIDSAADSLRMLYYIFRDDQSGRSVKEAILRAVGRGVTVWLLVDGFGSGKTPRDFFDDLREAGVRFCIFYPKYGRRYLIRNHQKMCIADDDKVMIGGFNVEDDYFKGVDAGGWRDIGLIVEGPAAARLAVYYDALHAWVMKPGARVRELRGIIERFSETEGKLQWSFGGPTRKLSPWARATCRDLERCRDVEFIAAYFAPTPGMLRKIERVVERGGRARIITAAKSDNDATIGAARWTYARLLRKGVEIFEYLPTKLHAKLVVFDETVHIGSSNFDIRSLFLNLEMMLRVEDPAFATMMRIHFEQEVCESRAITPTVYRGMASVLNRVKWAFGFFMVTIADYTVTRRLNFGLE